MAPKRKSRNSTKYRSGSKFSGLEGSPTKACIRGSARQARMHQLGIHTVDNILVHSLLMWELVYQ
jgi:hypothetical protein